MRFVKTLNADLDRKTINEFKVAVKTPLIIILDNIRSMMNVGSIFRTADAFLIDKIYLCGITPIPPHREINKTALGATETVTWIFKQNITEAIQEIKNDGYKIIAVEQTSNSSLLHRFNILPACKYALILGNEVDGVSNEALQQSDECIELPQLGNKHSFNIAVCAGIVLWEFFKKNSF